MATYMIDYENVKTGGLNGISRLTQEDRVIIFYSENANRITFDLHKRLMECKAQIEYREVLVGGHNALDFQLVTYLGYLIAQDKCGQYLIISNDRGFEYVINFWRKDGLSIGLLPYLKDPAYALQKVARVKEECVCEENAEPEQAEPACEDAPLEEAAEAVEEVFAQETLDTEMQEEAEENEPAIEVEFYSIEEEPAVEPAPAAEPVQEQKKPKRPARKKAQLQKADEPKEKAEVKPEEKPADKEVKKPAKKVSDKTPDKSADKPARKIPTMDELRDLIGSLVEDDPELRFVSTAISKYKTKLGLNNALVKNFGNQKAGEIYQKVKQFAK